MTKSNIEEFNVSFIVNKKNISINNTEDNTDRELNEVEWGKP